MSIKEKILVCYPHLSTKCIHKVVGCSKGHAHMVIKSFGLPYMRNSEIGLID